MSGMAELVHSLVFVQHGGGAEANRLLARLQNRQMHGTLSILSCAGKLGSAGPAARASSCDGKEGKARSLASC